MASPLPTTDRFLDGFGCLVTGASSGIGRATCAVLTQYGATVVGTGRDESALQQVRNEGHVVDYIVADLTQPGACARVVEETVTKLANASSSSSVVFSTLVNAAGVLVGGGMDTVSSLDNYHANLHTNAQVPFELTMHAIPHLKQLSSSSLSSKVNASIVNVSSVNGKQSFAGCVAYCMSKAAVDQLTRCASVDLAKLGIRVNSVNPGVVTETKLQTRGGMTADAYEQFLHKSVTQTHPIAQHLQRVGQPHEIGQVIAFLVSNRALFLTGECIAVDGARQNLGAR